MLGNRSLVGLLAFLTGCWLPAASGPARAAGPAGQSAAHSPAAAHPPAATSSPVRPVLEKYCLGCHNQRLRTAGLMLDTADPEHMGADAEVWEKVIRKLRAGAMPPVGRPRPDQSTVEAVIAWLETELDTFAAAHPNPGRFAAVRRLNRFEYQAAVSDLLGLETDVSDLLPMDNTSDEGFDNYVSQLSVSPLLVERYLTAARRISAAAVGIAPEGPTVERHGAGDRDRVDQYVESVRDVERRLRIADRQAADELPLLERPAGIPPGYGEHARLMFDLQLLAYQTDLTRVITFMMAREQSSLTYSEIGVPDSHHPLSHHAHQPARVATMARINAYHCQLFADYVARLAATPDGDGTLLDHVMIVYGSGISDSMEHVKDNLPIAVVGGGAGTIRGGRHLDYGGGNRSDWDTDGRGVKADVPPLSNLCLTLMDKLGVPVDRLGDSTGPLHIDAEVSL